LVLGVSSTVSAATAAESSISYEEAPLENRRYLKGKETKEPKKTKAPKKTKVQ
jgi:hypothetical protein